MAAAASSFGDAAALSREISKCSQRAGAGLEKAAGLLRQQHPTAAQGYGVRGAICRAFVLGLPVADQDAHGSTTRRRRGVFHSDADIAAHTAHMLQRRRVQNDVRCFFARFMFVAYGERGWTLKGISQAHYDLNHGPDQAAAKKRRRLQQAQAARDYARIGREVEAERLAKRAPEIVYVIQCEHKCVYVGTTDIPSDDRLEVHRKGMASWWTRLHRPLFFLKVVNCLEDLEAGFLEDAFTKHYMLELGSGYVRGGTYCERNGPSQAAKEVLHEEMVHAQKKCHHCQSSGHFAGDCPERRHARAAAAAAAEDDEDEEEEDEEES